MLTRKKFWDTDLFHTFLLERAQVPFAWGSNDCATCSADGILAITGEDIMADLRGYKTFAGSTRKIASVTGGQTLEDAIVWCAAKYGLRERPHPLFASRGDLVLWRNADGISSAGLVHLNGRDVVCPGDDGLRRVPLPLVQRAWTY